MRRLTLSVTLSLLISGAVTVGLPPSVAADDAIELPRAVHGDAALRLLGDDLEAAAALNGTTATALAELLRTDSSAWLDRSGSLFFKDPGVSASAVASRADVALAPLEDTFELHSLPGSQHTIFLDFDGSNASATEWHDTYPGIPNTQPAWDPSFNGSVFDDDERTAIQTVWQIVAEDYAPFDVDVTTADPGSDAINRTSASDPTYGTHVLVTPSNATAEAICPGGCGGVAYFSVFDEVNGPGGNGYGYNQPAWVFPQMLLNRAKNVGEAASHEAGHNLGLRHDANSLDAYDDGHGAWAPIMGNGYNRPISQWSQGDYDDATNAQDDVTIIDSFTGRRTDEAGSGIAGAPLVPSGSGYITSRTDVDTFVLGTCTGTVNIAANSLAAFANLDVRVSLLNASGAEVAAADPASAMVDENVASGMSASLSYAATPGAYYVSVDGVGNGPWSTGYDDYASMGAYVLSATGCVAPAATSATLTSAVTGRSAQLTTTVSAASGTPVGTVEFRDGDTVVGTATVTAASPTVSVTAADLTKGVHAFRATFVPASVATFAGSQSPAVSATVVATSTATSLQGTSSAQTVTLSAAVTASAGQPAGDVEFRDLSTVVGTAAVSGGTASLVLTGVAPGAHSYIATFRPQDTQRYDGSISGASPITVGLPVTSMPTGPPAPTATPTIAPPAAPTRVASKLRIVAPTKARPGSRPVVKVVVRRGFTPAAGQVVVTIGKKEKVLTLKAGVASVKLPKLKTGKLKLSATYLGTADTMPSTISWTIKVKR